jgi:hypothetical protein
MAYAEYAVESFAAAPFHKNPKDEGNKVTGKSAFMLRPIAEGFRHSVCFFRRS